MIPLLFFCFFILLSSYFLSFCSSVLSSKLRVALPWKNYFDKFPRLFGVVLFFLCPLMVNNFVAVLPFAIGEVEKAFAFVYDGLIEGQPRSKE